jgi:apocytochrome f
VCANCHLAEAPIRLSGPSAVFASSIFDLLIEIPTLLTASQVSPAGDLVDLNVGGVVVLPEGFGKSVAADVSVSSGGDVLDGDRQPLLVSNLWRFVNIHGAGVGQSIFTPFSAAEPNVFVFGPVPASEYATAVLSVLAPRRCRSLSFPIVVAGNRGRGPLYPVDRLQI